MSEQEWGEEVDMLNVVCPDCAFSYCHIHTDADGSYSCPLCAEAALTAERDRYREALEEVQTLVTAAGIRCFDGVYALVLYANTREDAERVLPLLQGPESEE